MAATIANIMFVLYSLRLMFASIIVLINFDSWPYSELLTFVNTNQYWIIIGLSLRSARSSLVEMWLLHTGSFRWRSIIIIITVIGGNCLDNAIDNRMLWNLTRESETIGLVSINRSRIKQHHSLLRGRLLQLLPAYSGALCPDVSVVTNCFYVRTKVDFITAIIFIRIEWKYGCVPPASKSYLIVTCITI